VRVEAAPLTAAYSRTGDFVALAKPRLNMLVVASTLVGYAMADGEALGLLRLCGVLLGTGLVAGGASAFNQVLERDLDALMRRTRRRPLPDQRVQPQEGVLFGAVLTVAGLLLIAAASNLIAAGVALATLVSYIAIYTPLKRRSSFSTVIGAIPGALPPIIGWSAVTGTMPAQAWTLFGIMFLWQLPHFLAIGWLYREDYARGGFPMLGVMDPEGAATGRQMILYTTALLPVTLAAGILAAAGRGYLWGALVLGLLFLGFALLFAARPNPAAARRVFLLSVLYLPVLLGLMVFDR
jgi:protoheme IX farnesyltransferase